jgi:hypothetical protein
MRKQKDDPFPRSEFRDRFDALITAGERSGISLAEIAALLEGRAIGLRQRHTAAEPVESARMPRTTVVGGNGNIAQRLVAAVRGEYE